MEPSIKQLCLEQGGAMAAACLPLLEQLQVCDRCTLRMLGVRSVASPPSTDAAPSLPHQCPPDASQPCCPVCRGVLQPHAHHHRVPVSPDDQPTHGQPGQWTTVPPGCLCNALVTAVLASGLQGPSFCLELSLPAGIALRQASLSAWLERQLGGEVWAHTRRVMDILTPKESVREAMESAVETATGMQRGREMDVELKVSVVLRGDPAEASPGLTAVWAAVAKGLSGALPSKRGRADQSAGGDANVARAYSPALVNAVNTLDAAVLLGVCDWDSLITTAAQQPACGMLFKCTRRTMYVGGRYRKTSRDVSQSPWYIEGGPTVVRTSIQEELERRLQPLLQAEATSFTASGNGNRKPVHVRMLTGREDVDVLMLGRGRPFALEVVNSCLPMPPPEALAAVQQSLAASKCGVEVTSLKHLSPAVVSALKQGEEHKEKSYRALCVASKAITQADLDAVLTVVAGGPRLDLKQQTPLRVMHRRALKTREKHVVSMHAVVVAAPVENGAVGNENGPVAGDVVSSRWFELHVRTSAGMYVKEFVHGDFGRTVPCVGGLLGCDTDLLLLDVMDVHLDDVDGL